MNVGFLFHCIKKIDTHILQLLICKKQIKTIALGRRKSKKFEVAWREAQKQMLDSNRNYDYGPYKLCKFFDPNTLEEIGKVMMHKTSVEAFLDYK